MRSQSTNESKVQVTWVDGYLFVGSDEKGHSIDFESSEAAEGGRAIGPMNALLASAGACSGMDVVAILGKRKQNLTSLTVEVSGTRPKFGVPKPFTKVHLRYLITGKGLEERLVEEAVGDSVKKYCSVIATLDKKVSVEYSYDITEG